MTSPKNAAPPSARNGSLIWIGIVVVIVGLGIAAVFLARGESVGVAITDHPQRGAIGCNQLPLAGRADAGHENRCLLSHASRGISNRAAMIAAGRRDDTGSYDDPTLLAFFQQREQQHGQQKCAEVIDAGALLKPLLCLRAAAA